MFWVKIRGIPGYEISSEGDVRNEKNGRILRPYLNRPGGYLKVKINDKQRYVHRLVAETFLIEYIEDDEKIIHIDNNKLNNNYRNLRIVKKKNGEIVDRFRRL